jgi:hypothetical protein
MVAGLWGMFCCCFDEPNEHWPCWYNPVLFQCDWNSPSLLARPVEGKAADPYIIVYNHRLHIEFSFW